MFSLCASLYRLAPLIIHLSLNPWRSGHGGLDGQPGSFPAIFDVSCKYISAGLHHTYHHLLILATVELKDNQWIVAAKERMIGKTSSLRWLGPVWKARIPGASHALPTRDMHQCLLSSSPCNVISLKFGIFFDPTFTLKKRRGTCNCSSKNMYKGPFPATYIFMYEVFRLKITGACLYQL